MRHYNILHTESSTGWGGQEIRIITEAVGMMRRGHRVTIACRPGSVIRGRASEQGIETFVTRMKGAFDMAGIRQLRSFIREKKVDIVNTHSSKDSWCAGLAARLTSVKVIRTRHLSIPIKRGFESRFLYGTLADIVVTTGESLRLHVIERTGLTPNRAISIPTGIDLERFNPANADGSRVRAELGIPANTPLVGTVGMLRRMKGHPYLIKAMAQVAKKLPEARLVIVGDTAFASSIKEILAAQIEELGIGDKVIMTGYREDIPDVMAALDVFVLASIKDEGVPQVINQAMAMKRPVVATNVGAVSEQVIDGQTGFLVEKENSERIAQSVLRILDDPSLAKQMGENGRKLVEEKFSIETMLDATEALYARLLSE
jgi:glycosyltransferase involved in cell wall biosynthesis